MIYYWRTDYPKLSGIKQPSYDVHNIVSQEFGQGSAGQVFCSVWHPPRSLSDGHLVAELEVLRCLHSHASHLARITSKLAHPPSVLDFSTGSLSKAVGHLARQVSDRITSSPRYRKRKLPVSQNLGLESVTALLCLVRLAN